jgi:hypothetical protein
MGPTCTDEQIAGMVALDKAASSGGNSPPAAPGNASATSAPPVAAIQSAEPPSPRVVVAGILDLVQSALADDATRTLDEIMYPITGLQHVQRYARAVLDDDGHDPARLAGNYLEIINALLNTADLAEGSAARPPAPGIDAQQYRQLAARMRSMSGDLAALVMPITSSTKSSDATPELRAARAVLDITRMTRGESSAPGSPWRAWMLTELNTLDHAAQSVLSDGPGEPGATSLRLNLFRASIKATALQAERISARADSPSEARRKTSSLAASLRDIAGRFEPARTLPAAAPGVVPAGKDWLVTMRSVGPLAVGTSINDARAIIGDPAAYLVQALRQDHALPREPDSAACAYLATTAVPAGLGLMFQSGRLARVDIWQPGVRTTDGAQVGDSEARIRGIYGSALRITQHHYPPVGAHDMTLEPADVADRDYLLRFETDGDKVTQFRIGIREAVEATEGCE